MNEIFSTKIIIEFIFGWNAYRIVSRPYTLRSPSHSNPFEAGEPIVMLDHTCIRRIILSKPQVSRHT